MNQLDFFTATETPSAGPAVMTDIPEYRVQHVRHTMVEEAQARMNKAPETVSTFRSIVAGCSWFDPMKECVVVFALDRKNKVLGYNLVSLGTVSSSLVHPREVFRPLICAAASVFVMVHNHPSGDPAPSTADIQITRQIKEAAKTVDIQFMDHVIVGHEKGDPLGRGYYSFKEAGLI